MTKPSPCLDRRTGKPFSWENPNFTPGKHCTSCRFAELPTPRFEDFKYTCGECIDRIRAWMKRSRAAKNAAARRRLRG